MIHMHPNKNALFWIKTGAHCDTYAKGGFIIFPQKMIVYQKPQFKTQLNAKGEQSKQHFR